MSTILKALRRLEQEKAAQSEGRPLREEIAGAVPEPAERPWRRWLPTALVGLAVGAVVGPAVVAWLHWGPETPPAEVAAAAPPAESPAAPAAREPSLPPPAAADEPDSFDTDAFASPVEVVERPPALPRLSDPSPVQPVQRPKPGQQRPVEKSSAAERARRSLADAAAAGLIDAPPRATEPPPPAPAAAPVEVAEAPAKPEPKPAPPPEPVRATPAPKPAPERVAAAPAPKPAPKLELPPEPAPPPLPALLVEKTLWHPSADRRRAWLRVDGEERRVVEGDVVEGLLVAEIEPSGIVFEREGERIRRGLGSSP